MTESAYTPNEFRLLQTSAPEKRQTLEAFLGLVSYYRRFVPNLSKIKSPLREIVKDTKFSWSESAQRSFDSIKRAIATNTVLAYPDPAATLVVNTDASDVGLGAVLSQIGADNVERPIAFASRVLSVNVTKWTVMERECLAAVWAITD